MKLTDKVVNTLLLLLDGERIPASAAKNKLIDELITEKILLQKGKHQKTIQCTDKKQLTDYLYNHYHISDLKQYRDASSRADYTASGGDSKLSNERVFKGFLVNCYTPILSKLNGEDFLINPTEGSFVFIYDFESFRIDNNVTIVGVENAMNFRFIRNQANLFKDITPLFVSRYPQNQSKDFISWLKSVPNKYIHFGDIDIAGIGIYINEYKKHLGERASFFIPECIEKTIQKGNRDRYDIQKYTFDPKDIQEQELSNLISLIEAAKKGLDQEFFLQ